MSDADIPIDIAVRKLLDWLVSRRICSRTWHDGVTPIREKIGEALGDMPEHEGIKQLLTGSNINYFHCLKIVEILKETEKESKNFFGSYGSQRMKDWQQIVKMYEMDSVYLAEAASIISQNVSYEGPGLKKALAKCDTSEQECDKKEESIKKRVIELENQFAQECKKLGISGSGSIRKEIIDLARDLPQTYEKIGEESSCLKEAVDTYEAFVKKSLDGDVSEEVVGNLKFLINNGNATTYEWKYKEKPISIEEDQLVFDDEEEKKDDNDEIDFGDGDIDFGDDEGIDFGDDGGEIDFGDDGEIDFGDSEIDYGASGDIDFGDVDVSAIVVEEGGLAGGVAKHEEALRVLDNRRTRALIIDDLEELTCFLTQRLVEKSSSGAKYNLVSSEDDMDPATLEKMISDVEKISSSLTDAKMQQLQLIRDSPAVVDRLVAKLKGKIMISSTNHKTLNSGIQKMSEKVKAGTKDVENRRVQIAKDRVESSKQLNMITERTKELKTQLEQDISQRYKGRSVNIMGVVW